mmetsp:Transcript_25603/g.52858  ORF Transcript_25603/g.52858 Transcript_25603/m.52858 type:complete len:319 (-) Transcript_25603:1434-2390(-)
MKYIAIGERVCAAAMAFLIFPHVLSFEVVMTTIGKVSDAGRQKFMHLSFPSKNEDNGNEILPSHLNFPTFIELSEYNDTAVDEYFMGLALHQAHIAWNKGEVPIGAVIMRECDNSKDFLTREQCNISSDVNEGDDSNSKDNTCIRKFEILSASHNQVENNFDASAHAELEALRQGAKNIQNWRFPPKSKLYSTVEPCPMCLASIQAFRIDGIVYGARDNRLGAIGTHVDLLKMAKHPYHEVKRAVGGVREKECANLMVSFFRHRRNKTKNCSNSSGSKPKDVDTAARISNKMPQNVIGKKQRLFNTLRKFVKSLFCFF